MAKLCDLCGRGANSAQSRSHSKTASKRKQYLNLHTRHLAGGKMQVCTSCLKTAAKVVAGR